jgi:hypothetical protein
MKNLIYQFWDNNGDTRNNLPGVITSTKRVKEYADRIGADYMFEENPPLLHQAKFGLYYGAFNPVYRDEFLDYDNVLFLDADIHPVDGIEKSIFDELTADIGLCNEPLQPYLRAATKVGKINRQQSELWANAVEKKYNMTMPRNKDGLLEIYNGGVTLYSNKGLREAREKFLPFEEYIHYVLSIQGLLPYFGADQEYLQVMLHATDLNFQLLDNHWNSIIIYHERDAARVIYDRDDDTKLIHIQFRGGHMLTEEEIWKVVHLPVEEWGMEKRNVINEVRQTLLK